MDAVDLVGAGLLAIQATRCIRYAALSFIASKPAPTGGRESGFQAYRIKVSLLISAPGSRFDAVCR